MLELHLYGVLRQLVNGSVPTEDTIMTLPYVQGESFHGLVQRLGLSMSDLGDCFVNGTLVHENTVLSDGDRIGLFPFNMVLLCGGQHLKGHGYTQSDVDVDYY
ncbi:MAG: MoaD/ThiS family protein [Candidatus Thorarchaeota archaeon]